jgi:very-short-patch-repair endonuclease
MQHKRTTPPIFHRAKELRREMTPAEAKLWAYLRALREDGVHFRRQHAIGPYIADFSPKGDDVCTAPQIDYRSGWQPAP